MNATLTWRDPVARCFPFLAVLVLLILSATAAAAQDPTAASEIESTAQPETPNGAEALRVFLDCGRCDDDYLRREITYVNYVRDRPDAQVHVLVTRESTGGGGNAWTLDFFGLEQFAGMDDQIVFYTSQDDNDDSEHRAFAQALQLGLVRYAAQTPLGRQLEVSQRAGPLESVNAQAEDDPWNFWVFRTRLTVSLDAEEREDSKSFSGSFSAGRTTDNWKIRVGLNGRYREDTFELTDSKFTNVRRNNSVDARVIKSVGEHMGFGFGGSAVSSSFRNQELTYRVAPAIEYNFFPYSESTRRQFTATYSVGYNVQLPGAHDLRPDWRAASQPRGTDLIRGQRTMGRLRRHRRVLAVP